MRSPNCILRIALVLTPPLRGHKALRSVAAVIQKVVVAIDGPAGAGKSTVARRVAEELGYVLVDTGALYRAVALEAYRRGLSWDDEKALSPLAEALSVRFVKKRGKHCVFLGNEDITQAIRTSEISMGASRVSRLSGVRRGLLGLQRRLAAEGGTVLEGRDIGTVVFPEAQVKVFLDASSDERARRRHRELSALGDTVTYERVLKDIEQRDAQDREREHAPLRAAHDACVLDSTRLGIDEVVQQVLKAVADAQSLDA